MRLKLDENVPVDAAQALAEIGWECETVYQENLQCSSDDVLAAACQSEKRILVTFDKDFGERRFSDILGQSGLILLRLPDMNIQQVVDRIVSGCKELRTSTEQAPFLVIEQERIRRGRWVGPL